jgi:tRNA-modifying protein YgfZ
MTSSIINGYYTEVSERSLLRLDGRDGLDLLQRISTNDVSGLKVGEHAQTVLTTDKGRILDVIVVFKLSLDSLLLAGLSKASGELKNWIGRFIVMEDVKLTSLAESHLQYLVFDLRKNDLTVDPDGSNTIIIQLQFQDVRNHLCVIERDAKTVFELALMNHGIRPATNAQYENYRIQQRTPGYPGEVSRLFNPLEVGLGSLVSFTKGCYVGQEVIARLDTYQKTLRSLHKLVLTVPPDTLPTELLTQEGEAVGFLTSCASPSASKGQVLGLGVLLASESQGQLIYSKRGDVFIGKAELVSD